MGTKELIDEYLMCLYYINTAGAYDFKTKKLYAVRCNEIIKELGGEAVAMPLINAESDRRDEEYLNNFHKNKLSKVIDNWLEGKDIKKLSEDSCFMDALSEEVREYILSRVNV